MVEFFSAEMVFRVWRYRSCKAEDDSLMISDASLRARAAFCSPSAAITWTQKEHMSINLEVTHTVYKHIATHSDVVWLSICKVQRETE